MRGIRIHEARLARALRKDQTGAEAALWKAVRGRALGGLKFVRQEPIGPYFADFVCRERKLIVEIDGATHSTDEELDRDQVRTEFLRQCGYRVVRFTNDEVYRNLDGVLQTILAQLGELRPDGDEQPSTPGREREES